MTFPKIFIYYYFLMAISFVAVTFLSRLSSIVEVFKNKYCIMSHDVALLYIHRFIILTHSEPSLVLELAGHNKFCRRLFIVKFRIHTSIAGVCMDWLKIISLLRKNHCFSRFCWIHFPSSIWFIKNFHNFFLITDTTSDSGTH